MVALQPIQVHGFQVPGRQFSVWLYHVPYLHPFRVVGCWAKGRHYHRLVHGYVWHDSLGKHYQERAHGREWGQDYHRTSKHAVQRYGDYHLQCFDDKEHWRLVGSVRGHGRCVEGYEYHRTGYRLVCLWLQESELQGTLAWHECEVAQAWYSELPELYRKHWRERLRERRGNLCEGHWCHSRDACGRWLVAHLATSCDNHQLDFEEPNQAWRWLDLGGHDKDNRDCCGELPEHRFLCHGEVHTLGRECVTACPHYWYQGEWKQLRNALYASEAKGHWRLWRGAGARFPKWYVPCARGWLDRDRAVERHLPIPEDYRNKGYQVGASHVWCCLAAWNANWGCASYHWRQHL